ncbi:MAG: hypothetical protein K2N50_00260, partial [Clostridia bacterium]|nr:hypothetical protein [Clostridia bacterium]
LKLLYIKYFQNTIVLTQVFKIFNAYAFFLARSPITFSATDLGTFFGKRASSFTFSNLPLRAFHNSELPYALKNLSLSSF